MNFNDMYHKWRKGILQSFGKHVVYSQTSYIVEKKSGAPKKMSDVPKKIPDAPKN
jgi:hypothetical protein